MKEFYGNMWEYIERDLYVVCITTNGFIKKNGCAVMGRGCAEEAARLFPEMPRLLGAAIKRYGNIVLSPYGCLGPEAFRIISFPVKHNWFDKADLGLIQESANQLSVLALYNEDHTFILPRPGCGNGGLRYSQVKPLLKRLPDNVLVITRH